MTTPANPDVVEQTSTVATESAPAQPQTDDKTTPAQAPVTRPARPGGRSNRASGNKPTSGKPRAAGSGQKAGQEAPITLETLKTLIKETIEQSAPKPETPRTPLIFGAIRAVMRNIEPLAKTEQHADLHFDFRRMDAICAALQPILIEHGVFYAQHKVLKVEQVERPAINVATGETWVNIFTSVTVQWRIYSAIDGSFIEAESVGEAMSELHFSTPAAQTMAEKTMLCDTFCIPVFGEMDPEQIEGTRSQVSYVAPEAATGSLWRGPAAQSSEQSLFEDLQPKSTETTEKAPRKTRTKLEPQVASVGGAQLPPEVETDDVVGQQAQPATDHPISPGFVRILESNMTAKGVTAAEVFAHFKVENWEGILTSQMNDALLFITTPREAANA